MPLDKVEGIVQSTKFSPTYCFAVDDWGVWHHVHRNNVSKIGRYGWDDVKPGSRLKFLSVAQHGGRSGGSYSALEVEVVEP